MQISGKEMASIANQLVSLKVTIKQDTEEVVKDMENILRTMIKRVRLEYALDFNIWRFVRNNDLIDENEAADLGYFAKKHRNDQLMKNQFHIIQRTKDLQTKIFGTEETIFEGTEVVD